MRTIFQSISASLLIGFTVLTACKSAETLPGDFVAVRGGQSVSLPSGVQLIADTVGVSICPQNANCILANNAFVSLRLSTGTQSQRLRLFAFIPNYKRKAIDLSDSSGVDFVDARYKIILRDGRYAPGQATPVNEVTIQVTKL